MREYAEKLKQELIDMGCNISDYPILFPEDDIDWMIERKIRHLKHLSDLKEIDNIKSNIGII